MLGNKHRITGWHPVVWQNHPVAHFDNRIIYRMFVLFCARVFFVSEYRMIALKSQDDFRTVLFGVVMITMMVFTRSGFLHRSTHRQSRAILASRLTKGQTIPRA